MGSGRGRSEGAELEGENKGVEGWSSLNLCVRMRMKGGVLAER